MTPAERSKPELLKASRKRRIAMGAGSGGYSLFTQADDLIRAYGATVADITVPEA